MNPSVRARAGLAAVAVLAVIGILVLALRRGDGGRQQRESPDALAPPSSLLLDDRPSARGALSMPRAEPPQPHPALASPAAWSPVPLPEEDIARPRSSGKQALKKCCDALRGGSRRTFGQASGACDRVLATVSSRVGPTSDALAAAALEALREATRRQTKASSVPAACR